MFTPLAQVISTGNYLPKLIIGNKAFVWLMSLVSEYFSNQLLGSSG